MEEPTFMETHQRLMTDRKEKQEKLDKAYSVALKPYDVVTNASGDVGFIQEVSINEGQPSYPVSYAVNWLVGDETKHAWFEAQELTVHSNILVKIAESSCHPSGRNSSYVSELICKT